MPEGDTLFRAARTLHRALAGHEVTRFQTGYAQLANVDRDEPIAGRTVEKVESIGKHLLIHFSGGLVLRTHLRMNGSWHIYRPGEKWRRGKDRARVVVETREFVAVGFDVPVAELVREDRLAKNPALRQLGPDLLAESFDEEEAVRRLTARPDMPMEAALLDQRAMAGVGNVFKSEILFLSGVHPRLPVRSVPADKLRHMVQLSRRLLQANVREGKGDGIVTYTGFRRTTGRSNPDERLWVYGRANKPCRKCATPIRYAAGGLDGRSTYWCPTCQPREGVGGVSEEAT